MEYPEYENERRAIQQEKYRKWELENHPFKGLGKLVVGVAMAMLIDTKKNALNPNDPALLPVALIEWIFVAVAIYGFIQLAIRLASRERTKN